MQNGFLELGIRPKLVNQLKAMGIENPTPIQKQAIPLLLSGCDLIGQAQTGTGKTFAFLLPLLERIDSNVSEVQALVIAPTRELALQITSEVNNIASSAGVNVLPVYGGQDVEQQVRKLKGDIHLVIGTPGRLLDHLRRGTLHFRQLTMLVLDEADQMLHMGFLPEVEQLIAQTADERQTMLFSATMPNEIRSLSRRYLKQPVEIKVKSEQVTLEEIQQVVVETTDRLKQQALVYLLRKYNPFLAIIFCRTKRRAAKLNEDLQAMGFLSDELHGDLSQAKREKVMQQFRDAKIQFLVATDVAARGLDVEGVTHVFNYDIPHDTESYIHRIGRTGRAGEKGVSVTFAAPKDRPYLQLIEKGVQQKIERLHLEGITASHAGAKESRTTGQPRKRGETRQAQQNRSRQSGQSGDRNRKASGGINEPSTMDSGKRGRGGLNRSLKSRSMAKGFTGSTGTRGSSGTKGGQGRKGRTSSSNRQMNQRGRG